ALNRSESRHDPTLVHFSNIFHHRWLTQFWQAWRSAQSAGGGLYQLDGSVDTGAINHRLLVGIDYQDRSNHTTGYYGAFPPIDAF
ncbi:type VI secretion system baseplate subunit TssG, partial [Salmonella enterica subsp. enterica serovar Cerro]|nr:type VI secretion system baseplate subunit TssG [Salmonella enterica subsp. enterica serovar Cerro]